MITEFEQRLAAVLGARLGAPLTGRVFVPPAPAPGATASLVVGVAAIRQLEPDFRSRRPEVVPGSPDPRRILRLECDVSLEVRPGDTGGRAPQMQALDAALFALSADDLQSGAALTDATDRGFLIQEIRLASGTAPLTPTAPNAPPVGLTMTARGYFWPVGQVGQTGVEIDRIFLRGATLSIEVEPARPRLIAGGPAVDLTVRVRPIASMEISKAATTPAPFGSLAFAIVPGRGTLAGGAAGSAGVRIVQLVNGEASINYTPPAQPVVEDLVIAMDNLEGGQGIEIGRMALRVREA